MAGLRESRDHDKNPTTNIAAPIAAKNAGFVFMIGRQNYSELGTTKGADEGSEPEKL